jgi:hypothetical protein
MNADVADVLAWTAAHGLPGLVDIHVHFMPDAVMDAVWRYFDNGPQHYGVHWPVHYRVPSDERVALLARMGVRAYPALLYPHKPGMAAGLNTWAQAFATVTPACVPTGTFFPEPDARRYVRDALDAGTRVFKAHLQVGGYDPRDALLDDVWGMLADASVPVVVHCGSGPLAGAFTGPDPFGAVLARHPALTAVIAHAGAPEYLDHLDLADRYPNVHLDTTMVATAYLDQLAPVPAEAVRRMGAMPDRIVLGTDFPNIPYAYAEQLVALEGFGHGASWLRAVCWDNGRRLLGVADV